ncbi:MAG: MBL fold metallo-hydrolase [Methylotenera sp.]|nr:MBL fold metallo-hydrolase [Flavobacterium sp.]
MVLQILGTGSSGNCYLFKPEIGKSLIIDCGVNFKKVKQSIDFDIGSICGVLQTHSHGDHSKFTNDFLNAGIDVYMSLENQKEIGITSNRIKIIEAKKHFKLGDYTVMPFDLKHDVKCLGFLIEHDESGKFCMITDTYYCSYTFPGLNNIIIEANYSKEIIDRKFGSDSGKEFLRNRILKSHFSLQNCKDMLSANDLSKVNNIVLIHLSDSNSDEKQFHKEVSELTGKNVTVASNGMIVLFKKTPF